jgi:DNA-binding NarL/FixJ family response regulator
VTTEAPIRVFVVDDHPAVLEGISRLLESEPGITVVGVAENAEDCFKMLGNQAVDVVVMDINLPGLDGIQATRQIKAKQQDLKIIILSSFGREYLDKAVEAGVDGYLLKTSGKIELVNAVVQAVSDCAPIIDSKLTMCLLDRLGGPERRECEQG